MKANACVQTKLLNHNLAHSFTKTVSQKQRKSFINFVEYKNHTQQGKNRRVSTQSFPNPKQSLTGMPMGYGTIGRNGAAHGSKAQTM